MNTDVLAKQATILVVDDTPDNLKLMSGLFKNIYKVKIANNGKKALEIAASETPPDLILLDIMMPEMDGYEVCERLKRDPATRDIPIIFLTGKEGTQDEEKGLKLGAEDYITKQTNSSVVLARVKNQLKLKASADFLRDKSAFLEQEVVKRTHEILMVQDVTILAMTSLAETRDSDTGNHIRRTQRYVKALAEHLKSHPRFAAELDDATIAMLFKSAPLHDIGKVGIPDRILTKPGRLDPNEFEEMKRHAILGRNAIEDAEQSLGTPADFLACAKEIAHWHHEKWDGSGYPDGKSGNDIPLSARLMAIADVYDALISRRCYKEAWPHEKAVQLILDGKGKHFDPDIVDVFIEMQDEFHEIANKYPDSEFDIEKKREYFNKVSGIY